MTNPHGERFYRLPSDPDPAPGWTKWLLVALAVAMFALALLLLDGCRHDRPAVAPIPPLKLVTVWTSCLKNSPPVAPAFAPLPGDDARCPAPLTCFDRDNAVTLVNYVATLEQWVSSAWVKCSQVVAATRWPSSPLP